MAAPDLRNLDACVEDARRAALERDPGPPDPLDYDVLLGRLGAAEGHLPAVYREAVLTPFLRALTGLGRAGFAKILREDPVHESSAGLLLDIAHAILQRAEGYEPRALRAFQEVVSDLYDGFLSSEDRRGVAPPDLETLAPLIKFGNPDFGPYTWPADATSAFEVRTAIVSLPPANARAGLVAWPALGHETAGHDILRADRGLLDELTRAVRSALMADKETAALARYWAGVVDEAASDVLGILNMGPAAGMGLVAYFRALNAAYDPAEGPRLRTVGPSDDPHPADVARGWLAAATVRQLAFAEAGAWADALDAETVKDASGRTIVLGGRTVSAAVARRSAERVAQAIATHPLEALQRHRLLDIQDWRDGDETIVCDLRTVLTSDERLPPTLARGIYAAHLVAAATTAALAGDCDLHQVFARLLELLAAMNEANPVFGPLKVRHAGDLRRVPAYRGVRPTAAPRRRTRAGALSTHRA